MYRSNAKVTAELFSSFLSEGLWHKKDAVPHYTVTLSLYTECWWSHFGLSTTEYWKFHMFTKFDNWKHAVSKLYKTLCSVQIEIALKISWMEVIRTVNRRITVLMRVYLFQLRTFLTIRHISNEIHESHEQVFFSFTKIIRDNNLVFKQQNNSSLLALWSNIQHRQSQHGTYCPRQVGWHIYLLIFKFVVY